MIKKLSLIALMALSCNASPALMPLTGFGNDFGGVAEQPSPKDLQEGLEYLRDHIGGDAMLIEANLYEFGSSDGKIAPDLVRSLKIYAKLFKEGNPYAAYKIGMLAWEILKEPKKVDKKLVEIVKNTAGLDPIVYFIKGTGMDSNYRYKDIITNIRKILGIYYFVQMKDYKGTIMTMNDPSIANTSTAQIYSAFAYYELKNTKMADYYLNKACNNPDRSDEVNMFCSTSKSLVRKEIGK